MLKLCTRLAFVAVLVLLAFWVTRKLHAGRATEGASSQKHSSNFTVTRDVDYQGNGDTDEHLLDLYLPKSKSSYPVLLFVHGGSWVAGSKKEYRDLGAVFAGQGVGLAVINYRLAPGVHHPAQIQDVARSFAWVHANIAKYGGSRDKLFAMGHSAGGHLVGLLGTDESYLKAEHLSFRELRGVIPISGDYDIRPGRWPEVFGDGSVPVSDPSPVHHADGKRPPFLILYAEEDSQSVHRQSEEFCTILRTHENDATTLEIKDRGHASIIKHVGRKGDVMLRSVLDFVRAHEGL